MAESPQEQSPGVLSRIGSWLSWGWGSPASSGDDPISQKQEEEASDKDLRETSQPAEAEETDSPALDESDPAETSPSLIKNAHNLRIIKRSKGQVERTGATCKKTKRSQSFERRTEPDQMGRRRSGRRRRSSHGDGGGAPAKSPTNHQPESPGATSLTSGSAFEEAENSFLGVSGAEAPNSGSFEDVVRAEWAETRLSEDTDSDSLVHAALVYSGMDEERVVRLTESAESKRRSIKVSHSEVVFAKKVVVASDEQDEDQNVSFKDTKRLRSDERVRFPEDRVDGTNVKSKGRIADKISLFERGATNAVSSSTNLRHLDISPARNVASRFRDFTENAGTRSSSAPPNQTVKERAMNFSSGQSGEEKLTFPSGRTLNERLSKTAEISSSRRFEKTTARTDTSGEPKAKSKPHLYIDQTDSKSHNATPVLSGDSNIGNKEADSLMMVSSPTDETPQVKSPNRTGTRSKKRRGKDPLSPTKQEMGQSKQEVKDKHLADIVKTTEQYSDKERPNSAGDVVSRKPKVPQKLEKAAEIMQSTKKKSDSKKSPHADTNIPEETKSKDEKERETQIVAASDKHPSASRKDSSQTEHTLNKEKTERTDIDSKTEEKQKAGNKKQPVHECSEGEGQRNRDVIVNTLFGESGKPDPCVTKEEKPPSPEDLKEASSKDSFEPANCGAAASRKDGMRNRGNEMDMMVLPEKKAENTAENEPKLAQRPLKTNQKSREKDCLAEITNQNEKNDLVRETTETHKHSTEVSTTKPTEQKVEEGITTKTTKQGKSKDTSAVRQEDTTIVGKETQTTEKNSSTELSDQTKEKGTSTRPNPALVKDQNDQMDTIISPQIPPTEGGGPKSDLPSLQSQSESGEEQKTQTVSSKRDLQQPSTKGTKETQSKITSTEMTSIVNGDIHSVQLEGQVSDCLKQSGENTLPEIPSNNDNLPLSSAKKKPTFLSSKAIEVSIEQSGQVTAKPALTEDMTFSLPASSDNKKTTLSNSADKKTTDEKTTPPPASKNVKTTPEKPTTIEKTTSPQASIDETTSTLPTLTKEKATPSPALTTETIPASLASSVDKNKPSPVSTNEKTASPLDSTNEKTTLLPASTNKKATAPTASADEQTTPPSANEKITTPTASANEKTTPPTASANEKTTPPKTSTNEKATPPTAPSNEKATPPIASANEQTTPPTASANEKTTPPIASTNEKTISSLDSTNEITTPPPASTNKKITSLPALTTVTFPASLSSNDDKNKPPSASTNETISALPDPANEKTMPPTALVKEKTTPPTASANEKATPPTASVKEKTTPPTASANEKATPPTASAEEKTTPPKASANEKATPPTASAKEKTTPPTASANEKATPPTASAKEKTMPLTASANETTTPPKASANEKTIPPTELATEKTTPPKASSNEQTTLPTVSANEKATPPTVSANEKATPPTASANEKATPPTASANDKTTPSKASANEQTTPPTASANEKTTPPTASAIEQTTPTSTSLVSGDDKTTPPSVSTYETTTTPPASTNEKTTSSFGSASRKTNKEETPPPASTNETTNEKTKPSPALFDEKTTPAKSQSKENAAPPPASTNPPVSIDIPTKNERTTPLPASSSFPLTSITGDNITPLPSSKEKTISPPDYDSGKTTPSPEKPSTPEVSAKEKISSNKSTAPSTRKKEFLLKPFFLPEIPAAPGSSSQSRDSPSSWLDVDQRCPIRKKLLIPEPKLSSSVSETNLLDTSGEFDPDDFITNVKRLAMPFNLPQRKHNKHRLQAPPFAMPAIKEDHFEKPFDPEEFQHGLRRRREFILDLPPRSKSKSQGAEAKEVEIKPKRESILTRSLIFQRARKKSEKEEEEEEKEKGSDKKITEPLKAKSRLERCSIVSILRSPSKGRRMEFLSPTSDGPLSPTDGSGSTAPPQSQLAPSTEPPKLLPVEEPLAKSDRCGTQSGSQDILKPSKDIGPALTTDPKTTSRDPKVSLLTDTNASFPPSGSQTSSQVVPKPTKDDGPTLAPEMKTTSADPPITMLSDTNAPSPSCTQSGSQDDGLAMTPDLKATSRGPTVTMLTDTNAPPPSCTQSGSQVVLKPTKDDGLAMTHDLNAPTPPNGSQTNSQVVLKPMEDVGPTLAPDLKTTSLDPPVTMLTDTNVPLIPSCTQSGSQNILKHIKDDGPAMTPDLKTTSRDSTATMFTDSNASPLLNGTQTGSDVVLRPDGPTLKTTTVDANAPPPLPSFDDIKLPSFLEKFLLKEPENAQPSNKIDPLVARESASIPGLMDLNKTVDVTDGKIPEVTIPAVPAAQILQAKPQRELPNIPAARGIHRRPGKIVIFEHHQFSGQSFEFYRDQPDATHMQLSSVISIKVVRGCWILYEKQGFEGRCIALEEEGVTELPNQWTEEGEETSAPVVVGSIRLAVRDYTPPRIELFTEPAGSGRSSEYVDDTDEVGSFSHPQSTGSIKVHSGLWLVYSDPGFQGLLAVLEAGEYPFPEDWGFPGPTVGSLRPLRMGTLKVEKPNAVKAVLYEKAGLEGRCLEVQGDVFSFSRTQMDLSDPDNHALTCVKSLKISGGLWVGFDGEGFEGQQFVLEEGEYLDWTDWGGTGDKLLSLRPVFMDFSPPHMKMFSELDFSERGVSIDLLEPLENTANTRYGPQTRSIEVLSGVWVVFEEPGFSGQQFVLEKGQYGSPEDWGASHSQICSAVPVSLENLENSCPFQIELFSEFGFGGTSVLLQDSLPTMPSGFSVRSCRVHAGSWLAFSGECFSAQQCVLEEGFYPDLRAMGFSELLSLQPTGLELSVPAVLLFERSGLRGRRTLLTTSSVNLQLTHSCSRVSSVLVIGGMWVLYEDHNFRGSQFLLKPGAVPDWPKLSSWQRIGSLRPLMQKQVHFRLKNRGAGLLMSVSGSLDDIKLMRIQVSEEMGGAEQIWTYQDGLLQSKCLLDVCVDVSSGVLMSGSRAVLSAEPGKPQQLWSITSDGVIRSNAKPDLVLEVKGGQQLDKHQIIVNDFHPDKLNQRWSLEIL